MKKKKFFALISAVTIALSSTNLLVSNNSQPVYARTLKRTHIPKRFRGNWYINGHKIYISSNTINGFGIIKNHDKAYKGTWKDLSRSTTHKLLIHSRGSKLDLLLNNSGGIVTIKITKRHGHKSLLMLEGADYLHYYRSKAVSKRYRNR